MEYIGTKKFLVFIGAFYEPKGVPSTSILNNCGYSEKNKTLGSGMLFSVTTEIFIYTKIDIAM